MAWTPCGMSPARPGRGSWPTFALPHPRRHDGGWPGCWRRASSAIFWAIGQVPAQAFIDAGLDLAVSALRAVSGFCDHREAGSRPLARELKRYALAHLGDPALSPQAAARANYISVRQLHRLFARDGTSFGAWVREERLRRCRDDLGDHHLSHRTVAEIATRWGFRSPAHFTRAFQARYGITPASLRHACEAISASCR